MQYKLDLVRVFTKTMTNKTLTIISPYRHSREGEKRERMCRVDNRFRWIPVFAGMTVLVVMSGTIGHQITKKGT